MQIVPVVDILAGRAVRAVRGERAAYRPLRVVVVPRQRAASWSHAHCSMPAPPNVSMSPTSTASPAAVRRPTCLRNCLPRLPELEIWLDAGFTSPAHAAAVLDALPGGSARVTPVIASESLAACGCDRRASPSAGRRRCCRWTSARARRSAPRRAGPRHRRWPQRVIVMTLDRVGSFEGPDLATVAQVRSRAGARRMVIGAGGVRSVADLAGAARAGADAWLVASALHDGRISPGRNVAG